MPWRGLRSKLGRALYLLRRQSRRQAAPLSPPRQLQLPSRMPRPTLLTLSDSAAGSLSS